MQHRGEERSRPRQVHNLVLPPSRTRPEARRLNYEQATLMLVGRAWGGDTGACELLEICFQCRGTSGLQWRSTARTRRPRRAPGLDAGTSNGPSCKCSRSTSTMRCILCEVLSGARCRAHREIGELGGIARRGVCRPHADGSALAHVPGDYALAETPVEVDCDDTVVWAVLVWANCGRSCCNLV